MAFLPEWTAWVKSHLQYIPRETSGFCGDIAGLEVLDVGCGDMLADFGLLSLGPKHITGIDVLTRAWDVKENAALAIAEAGFSVPSDYASRLEYVTYGGTQFPFPDDHFDLVFSWSAFEHIPDVPLVLREIRRVVKPRGRVFLQVYPWFPTYPGSHLADFIEEPFFHLTRSEAWVYEKLKEYVAAHPERTNNVLNEMWPEYRTLNRFSANKFLSAILELGFCLDRLQSETDENHLSSAPHSQPVADVVAVGTMVLLRPCKTR